MILELSAAGLLSAGIAIGYYKYKIEGMEKEFRLAMKAMDSDLKLYIGEKIDDVENSIHELSEKLAVITAAKESKEG